MCVCVCARTLSGDHAAFPTFEEVFGARRPVQGLPPMLPGEGTSLSVSATIPPSLEREMRELREIIMQQNSELAGLRQVCL